MTMDSSITRQQERQLIRLVEDLFLDLSKDEAQLLIEKGGELKSRIRQAMLDLLVSNRYADEEVSSSYTYPSGYQVKSLEEQARILRKLFPGLSTYDVEVGNQPLPAGAEGWFLVPRWDKVAHTYNGAVGKALDLLEESGRPFVNYRKG